jgi:hypothetical protein
MFWLNAAVILLAIDSPKFSQSYFFICIVLFWL